MGEKEFFRTIKSLQNENSDINNNTNLIIQLNINNDEFIPNITSGTINNLRDKTTLLIALHQLQNDIFNCKNINDLNERLKND